MEQIERTVAVHLGQEGRKGWSPNSQLRTRARPRSLKFAG